MHRSEWPIDRRRFLAASVAVSGSVIGLESIAHAAPAPKKRVAVIATIYRKNSHADVIAGKILRGWRHDGGDGPALELASMYVDQFPDDDMSKDLAAQHGFPIFKTIEEALTVGTEHLKVDGVISIGEHGDYGWNEKEQHLYPRRRFFEQIATTFERCGRVVPVFNDKHPGPQWDDAKWMYDRARELNIPWMAGSSLPVSFRDPDVSVPIGSRIESCVGIGYSGLDVYGFHTLDFLQCFLERRSGAETGVKSVQCVPLSSVRNLLADGTIDGPVLDAALKTNRTDRESLFRHKSNGGAVFLIHYADGLLVPVIMLPSPLGNAIGLAIKVANRDILATRAEERSEPRYPHFAYLLKGIEQMIHTRAPAYPVERTMLSAGMLDRLLTSRKAKHQRIETPELQIHYRPVDYGHAPHLDLSKQWQSQ